jgi:hypothetical protein
MIRTILLATCIVAVATPAITRPWAAFHCGTLVIAYIPSKYFTPNTDRGGCSGLCDSKYHFFNLKTDIEEKHPLPNRFFHFPHSESVAGLSYKGRECIQFEEEEYDTLKFPTPPPSAAPTAGTKTP